MRLFSSKISSIYKLIKEALNGTEGYDYTRGPIQKAVILLAIPMVLEMAMESVFALVDLYFVGHLENSSFCCTNSWSYRIGSYYNLFSGYRY